MSKPIPQYRSRGEIYQAATCVPLVEAAKAGQVRIEALAHGHYPGRRLSRCLLPGLNAIGYWDADADQLWGLAWHRNEGIEVSFLESGSLGFAVDHHECTLQPDDLTITRPWQRHRVGNPYVGAGRLHWLIIDVGVRHPNQEWKWPCWVMLTKAELKQLTDILRHNEQPVWRASLADRCAVGVNNEFAEDSLRLPEGAEIALLPPVSGG